MSLRLPSTTLQYVWVPVFATAQSGGQYNPTGDTVKMAFATGSTKPSYPTGYYNAVWRSQTNAGITTYSAGCLVGPSGTVTLAVGTYTPWVYISDDPEVPDIPASGTLVIW